MDTSKLYKNFISSRVVLLIIFLVLIVIRLLDNQGGSIIIFWSTAAIQIGIALFLLFLNQSFIMVRQRSLLPAFFYLLFTATNPDLFYNLNASLGALIIAFCFYFLLSSYQNPNSQKAAFNISLLLTLGCFLSFPLIAFLPLFLYGMYKFRSMNWRTFFASILGILTIILFTFVWAIYKNDLSIFLNIFNSVFNNFLSPELFNLSTKEWIVISLLILLLFVSGINLFMHGISEKIQTIIILSYLYIFSLLTFIPVFLYATYHTHWLSAIIYIPLSIIYTHYFTVTNNKWTNILFLFTFIFFIAIYYIPI